MHQGRTVFSQRMSFLPDREFRRVVARYGGDSRLRGFSGYVRATPWLTGLGGRE